MSMHVRSVDIMHRLPLELVTRVLEHLPRRDQHLVSRLSRQCYGLSSSAGRSIYRTIYFTPKDDCQAALATFKEVLAYALEKQASGRPGVSLRLVCQCPEDKRAALTPDFQLILDALTESLPVLVDLEAYIPAFFCQALYDALRKPAPRLRRLGLGQGMDTTALACLPPEDLFSGFAHRLHSVALVFPTLPPDWIPPSVFQRVTNADLLLYRATSPGPISHVFTRLRSLSLDLSYIDWQSKPLKVDLSGMKLNHLALLDNVVFPPAPAILGLDIHRIRTFERISPGCLDDSFWSVEDASSTAPLWARYLSFKSWTGVRKAMLAVSPTTGEWVRTATDYRIGNNALASIRGIETRLVALMLDSAYVKQFLLQRALLPALVDLYVDVWAGEAFYDLEGLTRNRVQLSCPGLHAVTLVSFYCDTQVLAHKVALFGELLKQDERPQESRVVLRLANVAFMQPAMMKHLKRVFPVVETHAEVDPQARRLADVCSSHIETPFRVPRCWIYLH